MSADHHGPHTALPGGVIARQLPNVPPALVLSLAAGRPVEPVWLNEIGGSTWRLGAGTRVSYLKIGPRNPEFDPLRDAARYRWLSEFVAAPRPLSMGGQGDWAWFETAPVPGWMTVAGGGGPAPRFAGRVPETVRALGAALRCFHDAVPLDECPFTWSASERLADVLPPAAAELGSPPDLDPVVCHGDACNPNFLLLDDLSVGGYVDLARCGVGDRWADLAPASASVGWNFGDGLQPLLLEGYGVGRDIPMDAAKLDWYWRLWDAPRRQDAPLPD